MEQEPLQILYNDGHIIAINKPSGLVVHRSKMARDASTCLSMLRDQIGTWVYPAHRLDRGTSGVLLFATDPDAARLVGNLFAERSVRKEYLAVVRGWAPESGTIDHPLTDEDHDETVEARTEFTRLATVELPYAIGPYNSARYSLVCAEPLTGRTHQIRRHMRHISHKIIGDTIYGEGRHNRLFRTMYNVHRLLLHAWRISFTHPNTGQGLCIEAPLPWEFIRLAVEFGWVAPLLEAGGESLCEIRSV